MYVAATFLRRRLRGALIHGLAAPDELQKLLRTTVTFQIRGLPGSIHGCNILGPSFGCRSTCPDRPGLRQLGRLRINGRLNHC